MHVATQASCVSLAARIGLGMLVWWALRRYKSAVTRVFGAGVAQWLMLITMSQFHFVFYMSRPLPNTFALILGETEPLVVTSIFAGSMSLQLVRIRTIMRAGCYGSIEAVSFNCQSPVFVVN